MPPRKNTAAAPVSEALEETDQLSPEEQAELSKEAGTEVAVPEEKPEVAAEGEPGP